MRDIEMMVRGSSRFLSAALADNGAMARILQHFDSNNSLREIAFRKSAAHD